MKAHDIPFIIIKNKAKNIRLDTSNGHVVYRKKT